MKCTFWDGEHKWLLHMYHLKDEMIQTFLRPQDITLEQINPLRLRMNKQAITCVMPSLFGF
jgi:hypothetical protein